MVLRSGRHFLAVPASFFNDGDNDEHHHEEQNQDLGPEETEPVPDPLTLGTRVIRDAFPCPISGCQHQPAGSFAKYCKHVKDHHAADAPHIFNVAGHSNFARCNGCFKLMSSRGLKKHRAKCTAAALEATSPVNPNIANVPIVCPYSDPVIDSIQELKKLVRHFSLPLNRAHPSWLCAARKVVTILLGSMGSSVDATVRNIATISYLLFPGVIRYLQVQKARRGHRAADFINGACKAASPHIFIVNYSKQLVQRSSLDPYKNRGNLKCSVSSETKRVEKLCSIGKYGAAARCMSTIAGMMKSDVSEVTPIVVDIDQATAKICQLNPEPSDDDLFNAEIMTRVTNTTSLQHEWEFVFKVIRKLPNASAAGWTGWSFSSLKSIFAQGSTEETKTICLNLTVVFNQLLKGEGCAELWNPCRSVLIPKKDSDDFRSIGIGDATMRVLGKCNNMAVCQAVGAKLRPLQLGVGVKGGGEIAGRLPQVILNANHDYVVIKTDQRNAFNLLPRRSILEGLLDLCPELAKFFVLTHGSGSDLVFRGDVVGSNSKGTGQGNNGSSLYYCVGINNMLIEIRDMCMTVIRAQHAGGNVPAVYVSAFMDDITICCPADYAGSVCTSLLTVFEKYNVPVNINKCSIVAWGGSRHDDEFDFDIADVPDGFQRRKFGWCVGAPVGNLELCEEAILGKLNGKCEDLTALVHISPKNAFTLLRYVYNSRAQFLSRVTEFHQSVKGLLEFDDAVDRALMSIMKLETSIRCPDEVSALRALPPRLAGLGIRRHGSFHGQYACLASRQLVKDFILDHLSVEGEPSALMNDIKLIWPDIKICQELVGNISFRGILCPSTTAITRIVVSAATAALEDTCAHSLVQKLIDNKRHGCAATVLSRCYVGNGQWVINPSLQYGLGEEIFIRSLRNRVLIPVLSGDGFLGQDIECGCGKFFHLQKSRYHLTAACHNNRWWVTNRHNSIMNAVVAFTKSVHPNWSVTYEPFVGLVNGVARRGDINVRSVIGDNVVLDVVVHNPAKRSICSDAAKSVDFANKQAEAIKRKSYRGIIDEGSFVPFAVESTGRIGPAGWKWIRQVIGAGPRDVSGFATGEKNPFIPQVRSLIHRINVVCDIAEADIVNRLLLRVRQYDHCGGHGPSVSST